VLRSRLMLLGYIYFIVGPLGSCFCLFKISPASSPLPVTESMKVMSWSCAATSPFAFPSCHKVCKILYFHVSTQVFYQRLACAFCVFLANTRPQGICLIIVGKGNCLPIFQMLHFCYFHIMVVLISSNASLLLPH
jgi:hypothetical protein